MWCPDCRSDLPEGTTSCPSCGAGMPLVCPDCGSPLPAGGRFCPACGARVVEASAEGAAPPELQASRADATELPALPLALLGSPFILGPDLVLGDPAEEQDRPVD